MSTYVPGFHNFVLAKLATSSIRVKETLRDCLAYDKLSNWALVLWMGAFMLEC